jgi:hypothetical protein
MLCHVHRDFEDWRKANPVLVQCLEDCYQELSHGKQAWWGWIWCCLQGTHTRPISSCTSSLPSITNIVTGGTKCVSELFDVQISWWNDDQHLDNKFRNYMWYMLSRYGELSIGILGCVYITGCVARWHWGCCKTVVNKLKTRARRVLEWSDAHHWCSAS